jgi:hypothetical protein
MSEFTDFMTMKLIAERRLSTRGLSSKETEVYLLEQIKAVKNLNVRAPINMIGLVEVLANRCHVSKAEMVMEMLQSCIDEALDMIEKEGRLELFMDDYYHHMEKNYGVVLRLDESGKAIGYDFPEESQVKDDD